MTRVRPSFTPTSGDTIELTGGYQFSADIAFRGEGCWWYHLSDGPASVRAELWTVADTTLVANSGVVSTSGFTADAWNFVAFTSPYAASAGVDYIAAVHYNGHAMASFNQFTSPYVDPTGHFTIPTDGGRYHLFGDAYPETAWSGQHGADLEFSVGQTVDGSLAAALDGLTATLVGVPRVRGALLGALGGLTATIVMGKGTILRPNKGTILRPNKGTILRP